MPYHPPEIHGLQPSDLELISRDHKLIELFLEDLGETCVNLDNQLSCDNCGKAKHASCNGRIHSFLHDLLDINDKHFAHEETIMLHRPNVTEESLRFRAHRHAHGYLMEDLKELVRACRVLMAKGQTDQAYRLLYTSYTEIIEAHNNNFDDPFIQSAPGPNPDQ